jgi:hypothetical protein
VPPLDGVYAELAEVLGMTMVSSFENNPTLKTHNSKLHMFGNEHLIADNGHFPANTSKPIKLLTDCLSEEYNTWYNN